MTTYPMCGSCQAGMQCEKNGVTVVDPNNEMWRRGDLFECQRCGVRVITGMSPCEVGGLGDGYSSGREEYQQALSQAEAGERHHYIIDRAAEANVLVLRPEPFEETRPPRIEDLVALPTCGLKNWKVRALQFAGWTLKCNYELGDACLQTDKPDGIYDCVHVGPKGGIRAWGKRNKRTSTSVSLLQVIHTDVIHRFLQIEAERREIVEESP